jgi:hypothetical protein
MTRDEYLKWCKERALVALGNDAPASAFASMVQDLQSWEGAEPLYSNPDTLKTLFGAGVISCSTVAGARRWIEGFN